MKKLLILFLLASVTMFGQKFYTKTGTTQFIASQETFEPVEAKNESTTVVLNTANGEIASLLFIKAFQFKVALMQEHFNENYMDSDEYPKATLKGKIVNFSFEELTESAKTFKLEGTLNIKGKEQPINTSIKIKKLDDKLFLESEFQVKAEHFDIKIPNIVRDKIAKSITVIVKYELIEKK